MSSPPTDPNGGMIDSRKSKHAIIGTVAIFLLVVLQTFFKSDITTVNNAIGSITMLTAVVITGHAVLDYFSKKS